MVELQIGIAVGTVLAGIGVGLAKSYRNGHIRRYIENRRNETHSKALTEKRIEEIADNVNELTELAEENNAKIDDLATVVILAQEYELNAKELRDFLNVRHLQTDIVDTEDGGEDSGSFRFRRS